MSNPFEAALPRNLAGEGAEKEKAKSLSAEEKAAYEKFLADSRAILADELDDLARKGILEATFDKSMFTLEISDLPKHARLLKRCEDAGFSVKRGERYVVIARPEDDFVASDLAA